MAGRREASAHTLDANVLLNEFNSKDQRNNLRLSLISMTDAAPSEAANAEENSAKKTLPMECIQRLQKFDEALTSLELALAPILNVGFDDHLKRTALELVQVDVMTMFVINSLGWCLAAQRGKDPKDCVQLADELRRTKQYVDRVKSIETRKSAPGLNTRIAKAFVRNALWEVPGKRARFEESLQDLDPSAAEQESSDSEDVDDTETDMPEVDDGPSYVVANVKFESGQMSFPMNPMVDRANLAAMYPESSSSAIPGVPVDAPLTVKQHFQQQRKQQKKRARESRRVEKMQSGSKLVSTSSAALQSSITSAPIDNTARSDTQQQVAYSSMVLPEPSLLQSPQMRQSTSGVDDLPSDVNMKVDPKLLGSFKEDDYERMYGATTSGLPPIPTNSGHFPTPNIDESALESSLRSSATVESYETLFQLAEVDPSERRPFDVVTRSEGVRADCTTNSYAHIINQTPIVPLSESSRLENCGSTELSNIYASVDGLDMQNLSNDNGVVDMNGPLDQNHVDADPTSFDQGVEKLETETDDRFLNWLYCENEHAEDDNAEYTRVLEEIERDECYPLKLEGDSQAQDFGVAGCPTSNVQTEGVRKVEMDPSHPLSSDCIVGEYASLPPTMPPREPVPEGYTMSDYESDLDLDMMPIGEDEETMYGRLLDVLVRDIKLLTYNNAALVDEVSRLNYAILIASEERKVLARRSCHHDRNRIRRLQTANKRKSDAQKRQMEQLTLAETQENIAQIKAKMAKTIVSPQKVKPALPPSCSRPALDVAAIKRSVEAEQRALEERLPSKKSKRRTGSSKGQRKRTEAHRSEKGSASVQNVNGSASKRLKCDTEQQEASEEMTAPSEGGVALNADLTPASRRSVRSSTGELSDEQNRRRRSSRQTSASLEGATETEDSLPGTMDMPEPGSVSSASDQTMSETAGTNFEAVTPVDEGSSPCADTEKDDESQSWRRRSGRPPARAASAAAQTLLAAELAATEEFPTYSPKKPNRSRSNTNESPTARAQRQKRSVPAVNHPTTEQDVDEPALHPLEKELAVEIHDDAMTEGESAYPGDLELDPKGSGGDDELALGDMLGGEDYGARGSQRLRPIRRSTRTVSLIDHIP
ncbi:hypothetical protein Y032_0227g2824 [Ancylostoma ceylanicum]|uniref:Nuclear nucleic acid-binding protein C1D n=1 Tax=Ancylostoma ceylanicum TaxID=53326 RepID=A0A016SGU4_9BILA|nr:hypothetical protein Y032_0227g2824 [Ancylostoma ceylanicum]